MPNDGDSTEKLLAKLEALDDRVKDLETTRKLMYGVIAILVFFGFFSGTKYSDLKMQMSVAQETIRGMQQQTASLSDEREKEVKLAKSAMEGILQTKKSEFNHVQVGMQLTISALQAKTDYVYSQAATYQLSHRVNQSNLIETVNNLEKWMYNIAKNKGVSTPH
jgi:hypothetical protein